jgi:putative ABC transport system ATP-binding protein
MTIIQVTHNEDFAQYGTRIVKLIDGLVREDYPVENRK